MTSASYVSRSHGTMIEVSSPPEYARTTVKAIVLSFYRDRKKLKRACDGDFNTVRLAAARIAVCRNLLRKLRNDRRLEADLGEELDLHRECEHPRDAEHTSVFD